MALCLGRRAEEGKELIPLLGRGMNSFPRGFTPGGNLWDPYPTGGRLSTNIKEDHLCLTREEIKEKTLKLLSSPSNYDIHDDGKYAHDTEQDIRQHRVGKPDLQYHLKVSVSGPL